MRWIEKIESDNIIDFYYESMDYEDKPILAFMQKNNTWKLYSIWQLFADDSKFSLEEIINASKIYITEILEYLKTNYEFDFLVFLESEKTE